MIPHDSPSSEGQSPEDQKRQRRRRLLAALGAGIVGAYVAPTLFSLGQAQAQYAPGHAKRRHSRPSYSRPSYSRPSYSRPSYSRPSGGRRRHSHQHGYRWDERRHYRDDRHYLHDRDGVRLIISVSPSRW